MATPTSSPLSQCSPQERVRSTLPYKLIDSVQRRNKILPNNVGDVGVVGCGRGDVGVGP